MVRSIKINRNGDDKEIIFDDGEPDVPEGYSKGEADARFIPAGTKYNPGFIMEYLGVNTNRSLMHMTKGEDFSGPYLLGFSDDNSTQGYVFTYAHKSSHVFALHDHHPTSSAVMHHYHQRSTLAPIEHLQALVPFAAVRSLYSVGTIPNAQDHAMYYGPGDILEWAFTANGRGPIGYGNFRVLPVQGHNEEDATLRVAGEWVGVHGKVAPQQPYIEYTSNDPTSIANALNTVIAVLRNTGWIRDTP